MGSEMCIRDSHEQTEALGEMGDMEPPAGGWEALEARLVQEHLIDRPAPMIAPASRRVLGLYRPPARIAAAIALFLLGGAVATLWQGGERGMRTAMDLPPAADPARPSPPGWVEPELVYEQVSEPVSLASTEGGNGARLAVNGAPAAESRRTAAVPPRRTAPQRATHAEADRAARELVRAQAEYVAALQRVAAIADPASGNAPETRLAALDQLVQLTASALERVPGDPVINGYHLAAISERDALRREMDRTATTEWF